MHALCSFPFRPHSMLTFIDVFSVAMEMGISNRTSDSDERQSGEDDDQEATTESQKSSSDDDFISEDEDLAENRGERDSMSWFLNF